MDGKRMKYKISDGITVESNAVDFHLSIENGDSVGTVGFPVEIDGLRLVLHRMAHDPELFALSEPTTGGLVVGWFPGVMDALVEGAHDIRAAGVEGIEAAIASEIMDRLQVDK